MDARRAFRAAGRGSEKACRTTGRNGRDAGKREQRKDHGPDMIAILGISGGERCWLADGLPVAEAPAGGAHYIAYAAKPRAQFERFLEEHLEQAPRGWSRFLDELPARLALRNDPAEAVRRMAGRDGFALDAPVLYVGRQRALAAAAFYASPFARAALITAAGQAGDGGGWTTAAYGYARYEGPRLLAEIRFPQTLGAVWAALSPAGGDLEQLARAGQARWIERLLAEGIDLREDGSLRVEPRAIARFLSAQKPRLEDLARSAQGILGMALERLGRRLERETSEEALVAAGDTALHAGLAVAGLEKVFTRVWVQPARGAEAAALGAALAVWHQYLGHARPMAREVPMPFAAGEAQYKVTRRPAPHDG